MRLVSAVATLVSGVWWSGQADSNPACIRAHHPSSPSRVLRWEMELSSLSPLHESQWLAYYLMSCTEEERAMHHCTRICFLTSTLDSYQNTHRGTWGDDTFLSLSVVIVWCHVTHTLEREHTGAHTACRNNAHVNVMPLRPACCHNYRRHLDGKQHIYKGHADIFKCQSQFISHC